MSAALVAAVVAAVGVLYALPPATGSRLASASTAVAPIAIAVSAYLVIKQVQEAAAAVRAQLFDATAGRILDLSRTFVELPELRKYFYDGVDIDGEPERLRQQVLAVAELHIDFLDSELLRQRQFDRTLRGLPSFDPWILGLLRTSPAMCRVLQSDADLGDRAWYTDIHAHYRQAVARGEAAWSGPQDATTTSQESVRQVVARPREQPTTET